MLIELNETRDIPGIGKMTGTIDVDEATGRNLIENGYATEPKKPTNKQPAKDAEQEG